MSERPTNKVTELSPDRTYVVRNGAYKGRQVTSLTDAELLKMVDAIPAQNSNASAGVTMMRHILEKHGGKRLIAFVIWGQNIVDETGEIDLADFQPDPDEAPMTQGEEDMLRSAKPKLISRRTALLVGPSVLIAAFTSARLISSGLSNALNDNKPANDKPEEPTDTLAKISKRLNEYSSLPLEVIGIIPLVYELVDYVFEYDERRFKEVSNAVSELANTLGIGEATPTFRLGEEAARRK
jgi:hypothetical protein